MRVLVTVVVTVVLFGDMHANLHAKIQKNGITLQCPHSKGWEKDGVNYTMKVSGENVNLVKLSDKDTGEYTCFDGHHDISAFVFVRLCQNCVQLDTSTISGIVVGDLIATLLIALATYCVSSSLNREGAHQESDRQSLVPINDDNVYQHLGNRVNSEYSELTPRLKI
eukprot:gi/632986965/ref/XP_007910534.1/ PREDICTED: T-cell surface glycoprotein CD3 gamma chain [Callorhinchus milii]